MSLRVGLLGGTFDPVHNAHLQIAEAAKGLCDLDEVIFIPAAVPPHKNSRDITPFSHRANMIQLAIEGRPYLKLSLIESHLPAPSYTIDTLRYFHATLSRDTELFFIIGTDAFLDVTTWKSYRQVLSAVNFVILGRAGCSGQDAERIIKGLGYERGDSSRELLPCWYHPSFQKKIFFPCSPLMSISDISSSRIRQDIKANLSVAGAMPAAVLEYIQTHCLYV